MGLECFALISFVIFGFAIPPLTKHASLAAAGANVDQSEYWGPAQNVDTAN